MAGVVVLDAGVVIAFRNAADPLHARAVTAWHQHAAADLVLPASAYAEALVGPCRAGPHEVAAFRQFLAGLAVHVEPVSTAIAERAAEVRATTRSLRLPDALVLATGDVLNAPVVLTGDAGWASLSSRVRVI